MCAGLFFLLFLSSARVLKPEFFSSSSVPTFVNLPEETLIKIADVLEEVRSVGSWIRVNGFAIQTWIIEASFHLTYCSKFESLRVYVMFSSIKIIRTVKTACATSLVVTMDMSWIYSYWTKVIDLYLSLLITKNA